MLPWFYNGSGQQNEIQKSPYLFNIYRRLDFGAIVGVVIAIISVIAVKCGLELIYAVFLILLGIIIYIIITHIGQSYLSLTKNKPSSEGFYNFKNEAILIQNGVIFATIFSTNGLKISAPIIPKKRPATISPG